jgi:sulfite dehydrogenase (quinone) subunit SoeC
MHPAYSVLFFTTLSGAGYGLLTWLSFAVLGGAARPPQLTGFVMLGVGLVLVTAGLLMSLAHLGRPERAIKAFSQWRTSWLSREGVAAVATYVPAVGLGLAWYALPQGYGAFNLLALLLGVGAIATVICTGMIYASLPTILAWSHPMVVWGYLVLAAATGGILYVAITVATGTIATFEILISLAALLAGWALKTSYWGNLDDAERTLTPGDAIGLRAFGHTRQIEPPHTVPNFLMREMGYQVARKHAEKLRQISVLTLFVVPIIALLLIMVAPNALAILLALIAVLTGAVGVFIERWLFFAEAQHVVMLYYGAEAA